MQPSAARLNSLVLMALATSAAQPALACVAFAPFEIEDVRQADVVFSGKLVRYEIVSPGRPNTLDDYGLLTVRVDDVLKGNASGEMQLYWWNSTFEIPESIGHPNALLIAAVHADRPSLPLRGPSATAYPTRRPDLLHVMQAPCSSAFILPNSSHNADDIRAILRGDTIEPRDLFASALIASTAPMKARRVREAWPGGEGYALGVLSIIGAGFIAAFAHRRTRRNTDKRQLSSE